MKKIFTLLFCAAVSSTFGQAGQSNTACKNIHVDYRQDAVRQRDQEIQKVNYQNSFQVSLVVNDNNLSIWEKRDVLDNLEAQRIKNLNKIYDRYRNAVAYSSRNEKNNLFKSEF